MVVSRSILLGVGLSAALLVAGCSNEVEVNGRYLEAEETAEGDYDGLKNRPDLGWYEMAQGWNSELRRAFWFTPQGSVLLPYDWFLNLEKAERTCADKPVEDSDTGNQTLFRDNAHLRRLGYIPVTADPYWNPDGLPIGFAKTPTPEGDYFGLTCSACHSNLMNLNGRKVLVEGAPTLADLQSFNEGMADALCSMDRATVKSRNPNREEAIAAADAQFRRFAGRVLPVYTEEAADAVMQDIRKQTRRIQIRNAHNYSKKYPPYGKGRLDALGAILNEVAAWKSGATANNYPANAPVSYPFLWGASQSDVVQWNGAVSNVGIGLGPLGRNVGEVVGVYGHVGVTAQGKGEDFLENLDSAAQRGAAPPLLDTSEGGQFGGYTSSVMMANLGAIESWISKLRSPKWPEKVLGEIDEAKAEQGRQIYLGNVYPRVKCVGCHQLVTRENQDKPYKATMIRVPEIGTDPTAANNFILEANPTDGDPWLSGAYRDTKRSIISGDRYGKYMLFRGEALSTVVKGVIFGNLFTDGIKGITRSKSGAKENTFFNVADKFYRYKARPLNGIWATAPYLHNGSVMSLREMLTPEDERATAFCVGSREFDPVNVGFVSRMTADGSCVQDGAYATLLDTTEFASSNKGHSTRRQGVRMTDADKEALIEFLKTL